MGYTRQGVRAQFSKEICLDLQHLRKTNRPYTYKRASSIFYKRYSKATTQKSDKGGTKGKGHNFPKNTFSACNNFARTWEQIGPSYFSLQEIRRECCDIEMSVLVAPLSPGHRSKAHERTPPCDIRAVARLRSEHGGEDKRVAAGAKLKLGVERGPGRLLQQYRLRMLWTDGSSPQRQQNRSTRNSERKLGEKRKERIVRRRNRYCDENLGN